MLQALVTISFATPQADVLWQVYQFGSWEAKTILAVMASAFIVAFVYMGSVILNHEGMKKFAKAEFWQTAASGVFVIGTIIIVDILLGKTVIFMQDITGANPLLSHLPDTDPLRTDAFAMSDFYLNASASCLRAHYRMLFTANFPLEYIEKSSFTHSGINDVGGGMAAGVTNMFYSLTHYAGYLLIVVYFQQHLLVFIQNTMLYSILPVGVLLRVLPPTRGAGSMLMAISLGLYIVYPFMYALLLSVATQPMFNPNATTPEASCVGLKILDNTISEGCGDSSNWEKTKLQVEQNLPSYLNIIRQSQSMFSLYLFELWIYPFAALAVTYSVVKQIAELLGGNVQELGQGLIKLI